MATHLEEYLNYYMTLNRPGYAVLITGDWGSGKTFQIKRYKEGEKIWYISLYGMQSTQEIHAAVLSTIDPNLSYIKRILSRAGEFGRSLGSALPAGGFVLSTGGVLTDYLS